MVNILLFSFLTNFFYYCVGYIFLFKNKDAKHSIFYKTLINIKKYSWKSIIENTFKDYVKSLSGF